MYQISAVVKIEGGYREYFYEESRVRIVQNLPQALALKDPDTWYDVPFEATIVPNGINIEVPASYITGGVITPRWVFVPTSQEISPDMRESMTVKVGDALCSVMPAA